MCRFILQKVALFFVTLTYTQLPLPKYEPFKINSCCLVFLVEVTCILLFLVPYPWKDLSSNDLRTTYISGNFLRSRGLRPRPFYPSGSSGSSRIEQSHHRAQKLLHRAPVHTPSHAETAQAQSAVSAPAFCQFPWNKSLRK